MVERELSATLELLSVARQAQTDCHAAAHELLVLKRQIESASVQINTLRQRIRAGAHESVAGALDADGGGVAMALGLPPSCPTTAAAAETVRIKSIGTVLSQVDVLAVDAEDAGGANVCDVPGCGCGIPRDVFLRVASALNGDQ